MVGTVQDGGLPHAACTCTSCETARHQPDRRRHIASLALVLPASGKVYLVDATPDIRDQLSALRDVRGPVEGRVDRTPVDGIVLTHAHIGHYLGLAFLGGLAVIGAAGALESEECVPGGYGEVNANGIMQGNLVEKTVSVA